MASLLPDILTLNALDKNTIEIEFEHDSLKLKQKDFKIDHGLEVHDLKIDGKRVWLKTGAIDIERNYTVKLKGGIRRHLDLSRLLDGFSSAKPLGCLVEKDSTTFRLFAPRALAVMLVLFAKHDDNKGAEYAMQRTGDGTWELQLKNPIAGNYYGYQVSGPKAPFEEFHAKKVIADPYSHAVVSKNTWRQESKSIIIREDEYDWQGDSFVNIAHEDLLIYEMHVRDMTVHSSARVKQPGTYAGLLQPQARGGLNHILDLGVNAVELLPCQQFARIELPFGMETKGKTNTWNPYARNHWGYMTSYFLAPEPYYASGGQLTPGGYLGEKGDQVRAFKDMVRGLHQAGLAVIMDVVYNHVSQYDRNPLKYIDKQYYFRLDKNLGYLDGATGCGNELKSERKMARRMVVDSVKHWMENYHVDGFRFDLAAALDWETIEMIGEEARKINPNVILIAEPWSLQRYDIAGFSERGWMAWNDIFRNTIKGENPYHGHGFIFGTYFQHSGLQAIEKCVRGTTRNFGGPFASACHAVNYLASHDDLTLGDFVRLGTGAVGPDTRIEDVDKHVVLSKDLLKIQKLAAALLLTSQGAAMIHAGQEFAHSKVIAQTDVPEPRIGCIDHNSYNKDNETNWLNFDHKAINRGLYNYYRGLIQIRMTYPAFRRTRPETIKFLESPNWLAVGYYIPRASSGDNHDFVVLVNANPHKPAIYQLPEGNWQLLADGRRASSEPFGKPVCNKRKLSPRTAVILRSTK